MASKPETTFIRSIHSKATNVHAEKNNNPYRSGQADVWYSGIAGDLWVEYKFTEIIRKTTIFTPDLSSQQKRWLGSRLDEGRNVAVIAGHRTGGIIYRDREWLLPMTFGAVLDKSLSRKELAAWIYNQVGAKCVSLE